MDNNIIEISKDMKERLKIETDSIQGLSNWIEKTSGDVSPENINNEINKKEINISAKEISRVILSFLDKIIFSLEKIDEDINIVYEMFKKYKSKSGLNGKEIKNILGELKDYKKYWLDNYNENEIHWRTFFRTYYRTNVLKFIRKRFKKENTELIAVFAYLQKIINDYN